MWVMTRDGFVSVVKLHDIKDADTGHNIEADALMVRSRKKSHLTKMFPNNEIHYTPHRDYAYRTFISKYEVGDWLTEQVLDIDYDNFKNSVYDKDYKKGLGDCWFSMYNVFQKEKAYALSR